MTFSAGTGKTSYAGDGSQTGFPTTFKFIRNDHVKAILRDSGGAETVWVEGTHYTLTGAGSESGGTLTAVVAPAVGETLAVLLDVPFTQEKNFPLGGAFPTTQVEEMGDLAAMQAAKLSEVDRRTLKVPASDTQTGDDLELPIDSLRANRVLGFDSAGKLVALAQNDQSATSVTATGTSESRTLAARFADVAYNVKDFGATGGGAIEDTTAIQAAIDAAHAHAIATTPDGPAIVVFPPGVYLIGKLTWKDRVWFVGSGLHVTTLKAKSGLNDNILETEGFSTLTGNNKHTNTEGVLTHIGFMDLAINGNKANQTAGDGMRLYAKALFFERILISDTKGNGIYSEMGEGTSEPGQWLDTPAGHARAVYIRDSDGHGWHFRGPHDQVIEHVLPKSCGGDGFRSETLGGTYSGVCDLNFMHSTANEGRGLYVKGGAIRVGHAVLDACEQEAVYLEATDKFHAETLDCFGCCSVSGDYQFVLDADTAESQIGTLITRSNGRAAVGGAQILGDRNTFGLISATGGVNKLPDLSTGVGVDIASGANRNIVTANIALWQGTGAVGLRTANGGIITSNIVAAQISNCATGWDNGTLGRGNIYTITGDTLTTTLSGVGPGGEGSKEIWNVILRDSGGTVERSHTKIEHSTTVDLNSTAEQSFTIPHHSVSSPTREDVQISLSYTGSNTTWALQYMFVSAVDATNVTVKVKLSTAAGAAETANILMRVEL